MEQIRLICGYQWDNDSGEIGPAVLSMRDGLNNVLWVHELKDTEKEATQPSLPVRDDPTAPDVRSRLEDMVEQRQRFWWA